MASSSVTVASSRSPSDHDPGFVDLQLDGVEHDLGGGRIDVDLDVDRAVEGGRLEVGGERQLVPPGQDGAREAIRVQIGHDSQGYRRVKRLKWPTRGSDHLGVVRSAARHGRQ